LKVLADSCERDRLIARDEEARALSVRDNLRRRAKELALEPDQAQMWQDLSLQNGSLCSLLSRVSVLANEQLAMCVRSEAEIEALNVTTSLEEHWRDTVNKRDSARSSYIKLQDLYLHGMRSWQRQLDAAISKVDARLQSLRSLASEQQKQSHAMPASVNIDVAGDLDALFNSVRSVAHACSEAYAIRETESAIVQEEKRIADLRNQLHARTEETITGRRELELQERLRANREEAARALCELKGLNVDLKAGLLPLNPGFVESASLNNYIHSALNNTLNLLIPGLPINPFVAPGAQLHWRPASGHELRFGSFWLQSETPLASMFGVVPGQPSMDGSLQIVQWNVRNLPGHAMASEPIETAKGPVNRQLPAP